MPDSPDIKDEDIPRFVRRCYERYMDATQDQRKAEKESLGFYVGGKLQWRPGETESREGANRPWMTVNLCRPAVDQVSNEARSNPPGPECHPVGGGADKDGADILEGLIREYEYRCKATDTRVNALTYACAGGRGVWEMATDYVDDRSNAQQLVLKYVDDPARYFYDPDARLPGRPDSMWGGSIHKYSKEGLMSAYPGIDFKVFNRSVMDQLSSGMGGWMKDMFGWDNDFATASEWVGGPRAQGPYYVCEFFRVKVKTRKLYMDSDGNFRFGDEFPPRGVTRTDPIRTVPVREVWKYVVTAFDTISSTRWLGTIIPHYWVMGPEMWVDGKLYRLSLIEGAKDSQRGLNFGVTSVAEILGSMTKSPFLGVQGSFDVVNAQGFRPWDASNTKMWAYMEYKPVFVHDKTTGQSVLAPPPVRNTWEAPIARVLEAITMFAERIKGATSVFFEPSLPSAASIQSGEAIKALQAQTNIGTSNWQSILQGTTQLEYWQASIILPQITDGQRVVTIVRPDTQSEMIEINKEFPEHEIDKATGKHKKPDGTLESANKMLGQYSLRVKAGAKFEDRADEAISKIIEMVKISPAILQNAAALAKVVRLIGEGNPEIESLADIISPDNTNQVTPQMMQAQLQKAQASNQQLMQIVQKLQMAIQAKLPDIEAKKFTSLLDAAVKISVAKITASADADSQNADMLADRAEQLIGFAHEVAMTGQQQEHEKNMAAITAANASQQSAQDADQTSQQQQQAQESNDANA